MTVLALVFNKMIFEKEVDCKLVAKLFAHLCISESTIAKMILRNTATFTYIFDLPQVKRDLIYIITNFD